MAWVAVVLAGAAGCDPCELVIEVEIPSPDGRRAAYVGTYGCGVLIPYEATVVGLRENLDEVQREDALFEVEGLKEVAVRWKSPHLLLLDVPQGCHRGDFTEPRGDVAVLFRCRRELEGIPPTWWRPRPSVDSYGIIQQDARPAR